MSMRRASGFSLVEAAAALLAFSLLMLTAFGLLAWTARLWDRAGSMAQVANMRNQILDNLRSRVAWRNTINNNAGMICLRSPAGGGPPDANCVGNQPELFALYDAAGAPLIDSTLDGNGFDKSGRSCPSFSLVNGNDNCPFRYELRWSAVCDPGGGTPCTNPGVLVTARFFHRPSLATQKTASANEDLYSIHSYYVNPVECTNGTQQTYVFNTDTGGAPLNTTFIVPSYTKNIYVELWGGGGGGATSAGAPGSLPGTKGGDTSFGALITALGGAGGMAAPPFSLSPNWGVGSTWYCGGIISPPFGIQMVPGAKGADPDSTFLSSVTRNSCAASNTVSTSGGNGGTLVAGGFFAFNGLPGQRFGGGGGASGAAWGDQNCGGMFYAAGGGGGQYQKAKFTPAQLPPGTPVPVVVGAGGNSGGVGVSAFLGIPIVTSGGAGAPGLIRITWE